VRQVDTKLDQQIPKKAELNSPAPSPVPQSVRDELAVTIKLTGPRTWDLEQLNLSINTLNDATVEVNKIGELVKSLEGFHQQINSSSATARQAAVLGAEALAINEELERAMASKVIASIPHIPLPPASAGMIISERRLKSVQKASSSLQTEIKEQRASLNHELARLETAHLNSESSQTALRDIDSALMLVLRARDAVLDSPSHAVEACGALGARARALLLAPQ